MSLVQSVKNYFNFPLWSSFGSINQRPIGLKNGANFCYLNAIRQLLYCTPLGSIFQQTSEYESFKDIFTRDYALYTSSERVLTPPKDLQEHFFPGDPGQQDAQEALMGFLSKLPISNPLSIELQKEVLFSLEGKSYEFLQEREGMTEYGAGIKLCTIDETSILSLPIESTLDRALIKYCEPTDLESDFKFELKYDQPSIQPLKVSETIKFKKAPEHLLFNFNRFNMMGQKLDMEIEVSETFYLNQHHLKEQNIQVGYEIQGFINHLGIAANSGHYIAFVKVKGQWYQCNDEKIDTISQEEAEKHMRSAYIMYAHQKESVNGPAHQRQYVDPEIVKAAVTVAPPSSTFTFNVSSIIGIPFILLNYARSFFQSKSQSH